MKRGGETSRVSWPSQSCLGEPKCPWAPFFALHSHPVASKTTPVGQRQTPPGRRNWLPVKAVSVERVDA